MKWWDLERVDQFDTTDTRAVFIERRPRLIELKVA